MRKVFEVLVALLAALQSANSLALPPTTPASLDPTFGGGAGYVARQFVGPNEQANRIRVLGDNYGIAGYADPGRTIYGSGSPPIGFVSLIDALGNPLQSFGDQGTAGILGVSILAMEFVQGRVIAAGFTAATDAVPRNFGALWVLDAKTGRPIPGCGDANGLTVFPAATLSDMTFVDLVPLSGGKVGAVAAEVDQAGPTFRSGLLVFNVATCVVDTGFGNHGFAFAPGNFFATWAVRTASGTLLGGQTQLPNGADTSVGVFDFDDQGNPGSCGAAVRRLQSIDSGQLRDPWLSAGYFDPASGMVHIVGTDNGDLYMRRLQPDCSLVQVAYSYPGKVMARGVVKVDAGTLAVLVTELQGNLQTASRIAIYGMNGGAPLSQSPIINKRAMSGTGNTGRVGATRLEATGISNSMGLSITTQADGKVLIAGLANLGDASLFARYIGVERTGNVIEFHNTMLDHYFITADPLEAAAIDGGAAGPGWGRTGQTWKSGGPERVCRFYGSPDIHPATGMRRGPNSHFYTISSAECAAVKLDAGWRFESYDFSGWSLGAGASCPAGTIPVKRVYNMRFAQNDSNHRYTISDAIYSQMVAEGWSPEGVVFCSVP